MSSESIRWCDKCGLKTRYVQRGKVDKTPEEIEEEKQYDKNYCHLSISNYMFSMGEKGEPKPEIDVDLDLCAACAKEAVDVIKTWKGK